MKEAIKKDELKLEIVRQYYLENLGQQQIAKNLDISRSYVSKLLIESRQEKLVEIKINVPNLAWAKKEEEIRNRYNLKKVAIVSAAESATESSERDEDEAYYKKLGACLSAYLNQILKEKDIIGVAWGKTIYECSKMVQVTNKFKDLSVVQLCGGVSRFTNSTYSSEILSHFARTLPAIPYALPLPAILESKSYKNIFLNEKSISRVMNIMGNINVALFTVGRCDENSALVRSGYISKEEMAILTQKGAVGDVCTHFINRSGICLDQELDDRTAAVPIEILKNCETRIAIIYGKKRLETLRAVLRAGYANVLIIDAPTAKALLDEEM